TLSINSHSFSTFLSAFFDFPFFSPFFTIFPLHSLFLFILSHSCSLFYPFFFKLFCPSIPTLFSTFLSAFFDFPFFSPFFYIFPLHSLFIHSHSCSLFYPFFFQLFCPSIFSHFFLIFCQPSLTLQSSIFLLPLFFLFFF